MFIMGTLLYVVMYQHTTIVQNNDCVTVCLFNPLKHENNVNNIKYSVSTSKKEHGVSIMKTNWSMLFGEIIALYSENRTKYIDTFPEQNNGY